MATYTIVDKDTDPLGPGEIAAGSTIPVSEGDVFIIDSSANATIDFVAAGGIPANFDVVINESNANNYALKFQTDLTPTITVADNVDAADIDIDAKGADAINFTIGDNVQFGKYEGSDTGVDTIAIGNGFSTPDEWKTSGGDDIVVIGDNATFGGKLNTAEGNDTITVGSGFSAPEIDGGADTDTLNTQTTGATVRNVETTNVTCYAPGTLIDTITGPRAVETLRTGDRVLTLDHGPQDIRWVRSSDHPLEDARADDKPVLIAAGALGKDLPVQDLIVSPQHRILVGIGGQLTRYFDTAAFAPAKALTGLPGIRHMRGKTKMTYVHFACDQHEVVTANGCLSESLLLGPMVLARLTHAERATLTGIFGAVLHVVPAYPCLKVNGVRRQLAPHVPVRTTGTTQGYRTLNVGAATGRVAAQRLRSDQAMQCRRPNAATDTKDVPLQIFA